MTIKQGHIGVRQAVPLLWLAMVGKVLLSEPARLIAEGLSASWMVPVASGLLTAAACLPGLALMRRFPGQSFARAGEEAAGPVAGRAAGLVVVVFLLIDASLTLRQFSDAFGVGILPLTPSRVLGLVLVLAAAYAAYAGLEAIARVTPFIVPWLGAFLILSYTGRAPDMVLSRLTPFWGPGPGLLAGLSLTHTGLYSELLVLLILFPYLRKPATGRAVAFWAIALSSAVMTVLQVNLLATFDVLGTEQLLSPAIQMARLVTLGRYEARVDPFLIFLWVLIALVKLTVLLWAGATQLGETLRVGDFKPLLPIVTVLAMAGSGLPGGSQEACNHYHSMVVRGGWAVVLVLPGLLWLVAVLRGRRTA